MDYNDNSHEMGTPISNLNNNNNKSNKNDISRLVKELENNLDNFDNTMAYNDNDINISRNSNNNTNNKFENNNLDSKSLREVQESNPLRYNPNHFSESDDEEEIIDTFESANKPEVIEPKKDDMYKTIYKILMFLKYPFLLLILFLLVSSPDFIKVYENIPLIKILNGYYHNSSLFIKSIVFVSIFFSLKYVDEKYN
jgi:hypothetical protein